MTALALPVGAAFAFLGVAAGAFGAHMLKTLLAPDLLQVFEVAVRHQIYHAFALLVVGLVGRSVPSRHFDLAAQAFVLGIVLFSGSLYVLSLSGIRWLGAITPLGGVAFLVGWACLAWGTLRLRLAP